MAKEDKAYICSLHTIPDSLPHRHLAKLGTVSRLRSVSLALVLYHTHGVQIRERSTAE